MSFGSWFQKGLNLRFHWDHEFWTHTSSHLHQQLPTCQIIVMVWEDLRQLFIHQQDVPAQEKIISFMSLASTLKSSQVSVSFSSIINSSTYKRKQHQNAPSEMLHISWEPWWDIVVLSVKWGFIWQQRNTISSPWAGLWTVSAVWEWVRRYKTQKNTSFSFLPYFMHSGKLEANNCRSSFLPKTINTR